MRRNDENLSRYGEKNDTIRDKSGECAEKYGGQISEFGKEYGDQSGTQMQNNTAILETKLAQSVEKIVEQNLAKNTANMEGKLEANNNEVKGLKTALVEAFDQMKNVLLKMDAR